MATISAATPHISDRKEAPIFPEPDLRTSAAEQVEIGPISGNILLPPQRLRSPLAPRFVTSGTSVTTHFPKVLESNMTLPYIHTHLLVTLVTVVTGLKLQGKLRHQSAR